MRLRYIKVRVYGGRQKYVRTSRRSVLAVILHLIFIILSCTKKVGDAEAEGFQRFYFACNAMVYMSV